MKNIMILLGFSFLACQQKPNSSQQVSSSFTVKNLDKAVSISLLTIKPVKFITSQPSDITYRLESNRLESEKFSANIYFLDSLGNKYEIRFFAISNPIKTVELTESETKVTEDRNRESDEKIKKIRNAYYLLINAPLQELRLKVTAEKKIYEVYRLPGEEGKLGNARVARDTNVIWNYLMQYL